MSAPSPLFTGGCHCGAVRYRTSATPYHRTVCHCSDCRGTSGAPLVGWFSVPAGALEWVQGEPRRYRSSTRAERAFCGQCGTQLAYRHDGWDEVDLTLASLDDAAAVAPEDQTFVRSALPWADGIAALPRHATTRPE